MLQLKLIRLYFYVCQEYEEELKWHCQRFTKNGVEPVFSDTELLTTYLFAVGLQQRLQLKQVHRYIDEHWRSWFPQLPAYATYVTRLNRLVSVFPHLVARLVAVLGPPRAPSGEFSLTDSMPIMTCSNKRHAKVALELCNKGYNAVKKRHYYGVKLHAIGFRRPGQLPLPEYLQVSPASEHDLSAQRPILAALSERIVVADKAFRDKKLDAAIRRQGGELLTPVVLQDEVARALKQRNQAADDLYSTAVARLRQPIEAFFNWLIEKTDLQRAAKVRSYAGLLVHIFGKIAAAFLTLLIDTPFSP
jgi:hypothetical protein